MGRVAIVTGGGRGIGKAISLALARDGAEVAIFYRRDEAAARETVDEVRALGQRAQAYACDVGESYEATKAAVDQVIADFGKVDILVNNAGLASRGNSVFNTDIAELQRVINANMYGSYYTAKAVLESMRQQPRGDIIFISSQGAEQCRANSGPYAMAKNGQEALAKVLAKEERQHGIRVNVVRPGLVETEMGRRFARANHSVDNIKDLYERSPFGRVGQPEDIAEMVAFLVSEKGEYITGQIITVNGGSF